MVRFWLLVGAFVTLVGISMGCSVYHDLITPVGQRSCQPGPTAQLFDVESELDWPSSEPAQLCIESR